MFSLRGALVLLGLAGAVAGCSSPSEGPANVLLISVDTLRPDRLGCYGDVSLSVWLAGVTETGSFEPQEDWHASPNVSVLFESTRGSLERSSLEAHKGEDPVSLEVTITAYEARADTHHIAGCMTARWASKTKSDHGDILAAFSATVPVEEEVDAPR